MGEGLEWGQAKQAIDPLGTPRVGKEGQRPRGHPGHPFSLECSLQGPEWRLQAWEPGCWVGAQAPQYGYSRESLIDSDGSEKGGDEWRTGRSVRKEGGGKGSGEPVRETPFCISTS